MIINKKGNHFNKIKHSIKTNILYSKKIVENNLTEKNIMLLCYNR